MTGGPAVIGVQLASGSPGDPLLVVGPSLGASVETLWGATASSLAGDFHVVGWDLPGHGRSTPAAAAFDLEQLAAGVMAFVDGVLAERGEAGGSFVYAGDSVGGAVGLQLMLDHPGRVSSATLLCTGATIGTAQGWLDRAELVRTSGTPVMVEAAAARWFAPGFIDREPEAAAGLLHALQDADRFSYAWICEALARYDVRERLPEIDVPVLAVAGASDETTPVASLREIADGVANGRLVVLDGVAHQAPAEAPSEVARLIRAHSAGPVTAEQTRAAGLAVRRAVLGEAWVDRAAAGTTPFTRDFQDLITEYVWGGIWTRPGLDRRSRSLITLTAMVARGHHEELALHVRGALNNGLTVEEIKETLLQTAIYCGVPEANTAFRIAQGVLADIDAERERGES